MIEDRTLTVDYAVHFRFRRRQRELRRGPSQPAKLPGRIPRLARLMALAIHLEELLRAGVSTQAELARLGHVTRARLTQITSLRQLASDIQEEILFLPPTQQGRDLLTERHVRPLLRTLLWREQRRQWEVLKRKAIRPIRADGASQADDERGRRSLRRGRISPILTLSIGKLPSEPRVTRGRPGTEASRIL
jgi:hypothetical protein